MIDLGMFPADTAKTVSKMGLKKQKGKDALVSIITICFNSSKTIKKTIDSVLTQSYKNIEYIFIDGASKDNTLSIIKNRINDYENCFIYSEPDKGIYNAMNKGLAKAKGDIIAFINADDFYSNAEVLHKVVETFSDSNIDAIYGNLLYVDSDNPNKIIRKWKAGPMSHSSFLNGRMPPHPTFFVRKNVYDTYGGFNETFRISGDYELMLRFLFKEKIKVTYINEYLVTMRNGGISNQSLSNRILANKEDRLAWKLNRIKPRFYTILLKPLRKISQFFV